MCTTIDFDMDKDTFDSLCNVMYTRLKEICDPCSLAIYSEGIEEVETERELCTLVGKAVFNSLIVDALRVQMEIPTDEE